MKTTILTTIFMLFTFVVNALTNITHSMNVSIRHKNSGKREDLYVVISKKQNVEDGEGSRIAQVATTLLYQIDISSSNGLVTLPNLPLKLYPINEHRTSTFATFLPTESDGYFSHNGGDEQANDEADGLIWAGTKTHDEFAVAVVAEVASLADGSRNIVVRVWDDGIEQEPIHITLKSNNRRVAGGAKKTAAESIDPSIKDVLFHYYRGSMCGKCYSKFQEINEYLNAAIVGFLSPFVLLAFVFMIIAIGVFLCCDLTRRQHNRIQLPLDDEKALPV